MQHENCKRTKRQERYMKFSEDHIRFLDDICGIIREMIDAELDRRAQQGESNPLLGHASHEPSDGKPPRCTFWQRIVRIFTFCL
ncbi:MAG TPA: hypothetical protein VIQ97_06320 [Prevotella sp.]